MVISEMRFIRGIGEVPVHYCRVCGTRYITMEDAEVCEKWHKENAVNFEDKTTGKLESGQGPLSHRNNASCSSRIMYRVIVREAYRENNHEFHIEAANVREAAGKIREKFPHHSGYTIEPA